MSRAESPELLFESKLDTNFPEILRMSIVYDNSIGKKRPATTSDRTFTPCQQLFATMSR